MDKPFEKAPQIEEKEPGPETDEEIIARNFEIMDRDMRTFARGESIGGNAGNTIIDGIPCLCRGLNGYADAKTGKILFFGNSPEVPKEVLGHGIHFVLREAVNMDIRKMMEAFDGREDKSKDLTTFAGHYRKKTEKIIGVHDGERLSPRARKNIDAAIEKYNARYWGS